MSALANLATLFRSRWQIPLAVLAAFAFVWAIENRRPPAREVELPVLLDQLRELVAGHEYYEAANSAADLLALRPPLPTADQAAVHDMFSQIIYETEKRREVPIEANVRRLVEHEIAAAELGFHVNSANAIRIATAHEWLRNPREAIRAYRDVLARDPDIESRRAALQALVRLLDGRSGAEEERSAAMMALLGDEGISLEYYWWALHSAIQADLESGRIEHAHELLAEHGERLTRVGLDGYHDYLDAWIAVADGRSEQAEVLLDRMTEWVRRNTEDDRALARLTLLPALGRWLRGRVALSEHRPQEALAAFEATVAIQSEGEVAALASIGRVEALAALGRHAAARTAIRDGAETFDRDPAMRAVGLPRMVHAAVQLFDQFVARAELDPALGYGECALLIMDESEPERRSELLERLANAHLAAAAATADAGLARTHSHAAALALVEAAERTPLDQDRHANLLWSAANAYDQAGALGDARQALHAFLKFRTIDPRRPLALLQLGRAYAADGQFDLALVQYQELIEAFPTLEEAARARLLSADALMAMGAGNDRVETLLTALLEDDRISPKAQVYQEALLELAEYLYRQGRYGAAIGRLENALALFPHDGTHRRLQFMHADAYRQSARLLRQESAMASEAAQYRDESAVRFRKASELFGQFVAAVSADAAAQDAESALLERLARLYEADCLYELNDPAALEAALGLYRQTTARFQSEPCALSAQLQIANIQLRQGKLTEAARSVERARWLLRGIPPEAFDAVSGAPGPADWERYLATVSTSILFRDAFALNP